MPRGDLLVCFGETDVKTLFGHTPKCPPVYTVCCAGCKLTLHGWMAAEHARQELAVLVRAFSAKRIGNAHDGGQG